MPYYDFIAPAYNELYGKEQLSKISLIKKNIKISREANLLDVGCGSGISSDFDCFVVGIDPSFNLLKISKKPKAMALAEKIPFKENSFDYVISITSIHNFEDVNKSISEMKRVGKRHFVFSVLKKSSKFSQIKELIVKNFKVIKEIVEEKDTILFCEKIF
ncbi:class I SAM-dependent methyltransferase [Candidatus Woesearchaeota archaeon]|nr:class I SAM-dependent methyltransferase [Candidatus Woesearchaeota archaeon]